MSLLNNNFMTFGGDPVTGRVPTRMVVYADEGYQMSDALRGAVNHAYKLFCDAVRVTAFPNGYHVQNRDFQDGSKARFEANNGVHRAMVWPVGRGGGKPKIYCGLAYVAFTFEENYNYEPTAYTAPFDGYGVPVNVYPYVAIIDQGEPSERYVSPGRLLAKVGNGYSDKLKGIIEGVNARPADWPQSHRYWVKYAQDKLNNWIETDDVWLTAALNVFSNNKVVASIPGGSPEFKRTTGMTWAALGHLFHITSLGIVFRLSETANVDDEKSNIKLMIGPHPEGFDEDGVRGKTTCTLNDFISTPAVSGLTNAGYIQPWSISQSGSKFCIYNGLGALKAYEIIRNPDGTPGYSLINQIDETETTYTFSMDSSGLESGSVSDSYFVSGGFVNDLFETYEVSRTLSGWVHSDQIESSNSVYEESGTVTINLGDRDLVLNEYSQDAGAYRHNRRVFSREILLFDKQEQILVYTELLNEMSATWELLPYPGSPAAKYGTTVQHYERRLVLNIKGEVHSHSFPDIDETDSGYGYGFLGTPVIGAGYDENRVVKFEKNFVSIPTMQGLCPWIAYRNLSDLEKAELIFSYWDNESGTHVQATEKGFVDWFNQVGVPTAFGAEAQCFRVGGKGYKETP